MAGRSRSITNALRFVLFPALWVMSRLQYVTKFSVIAIVLLLPPLVVAWQQFSAATHQLRFNEGEYLGTRYLRPLHDLLDAQLRHWVAAVGRASGREEMAAVEVAARTRASEMIAQLDALDAVHAADDRFELFVSDGGALVHAGLQATKQRWREALDIARTGTAEAIDTAHRRALTATSSFLINDVANYSNLILDPDLDSYWLMDIAVTKAPSLGIDYAGATTTALLGVRGDRADWISGLIGALAHASLSLEQIRAVDLETSIAHTKDYGQNPRIARLVAPYDALASAGRTLDEIIKRDHVRPHLQAEASAPDDPRQLIAAAFATFDGLDRFCDENNTPLEELTLKRVETYRTHRFAGVLFTLLAVLLHFYVFAAFYFNIRDSISSLSSATARMIAGTAERFVTKSKDEISEVVEDFDQINQALVEARELRERVEQENARAHAHMVDLLEVVSEASKGNLTIRARTDGPLGDLAEACNTLMSSLEHLVGDVSRQIAQSERAIQSIAAVTNQMAAGTTTQATEILAARKLVDAVAQQIAQVSTTAEDASSAAKRSAETAEKGERAVADAIRGMEALRANVQAGAKKLKHLGDRSMEIASFVGMIARISEQTNLLALNATIEAARAGEHGRGFSVVAEEVRKLAERANRATKDIEDLVRGITAGTNESIHAVGQQTQGVEAQSRTVAEAGETLRHLRMESDRSAKLVAGITAVAKEQVWQAMHVARAMESVSSVAGDVREGADSTVASINDLVTLSNELRAAIGKFRVSAE
jgi:methyl-accepting chemotaxis protein